MHRNNNTTLFEKSVIDLLKKKQTPMSVSDISVEIKKILPESELPPKGHFLQWIDKIKYLTRNDMLKKDMPYFNFSTKESENKKELSDEEKFLKKYRKDFYAWLNNFKTYKNSQSTNYKMWDDLKKDYDQCLENLRIIKTTYPKLQDAVCGLRLKKMPVEVDSANSPKSINIEYKSTFLFKPKEESLQKIEAEKNMKQVTPKSEINILVPPGLNNDLVFDKPISNSYLNLNFPIDTKTKSILGLSYDNPNKDILIEKKKDNMTKWEELGLNILKEKEVNNYELSYLSNKHPHYDLSYESKFLNTSSYNSNQKPAPNYQQAAPNYQQAAPVYQQPAPVYQQPAPVYQQPAAVYQQPAAVYQQPASDYCQPAPVYQQPATVYQQPASDYRQPASDYRQPAPVYNQSAPVYNQPASDYHQSTSVYQQPTQAYQQIAPVFNSNLDYNAIPYTPTTSSGSNNELNSTLINQIKNELSKLDSTQIAIVVTKLLETRKENFNNSPL